MAEPTRRANIERMLKESPSDSFLLYALALELIKEGDGAKGRRTLIETIELDADYHAAYFQLGQLLCETGEWDEAKRWLTAGIAAAERVGNAHAAGEMRDLFASLQEL